MIIDYGQVSASTQASPDCGPAKARGGPARARGAELYGTTTGDGPVRALSLRYLSPVKIKERGEWVDLPVFSAVMRAVVRRLRILSQVHGAGEWPHAEFGPLLDLAETVRLDHHETFWTGYARHSQRGGRHDMEGFVGQAWYAGDDLRPLLPALCLGQWLHIGKGYVVGNGRYTIESANQRIGESANQRIGESANRRISESANQRISESVPAGGVVVPRKQHEKTRIDLSDCNNSHSSASHEATREKSAFICRIGTIRVHQRPMKQREKNQRSSAFICVL